MASKKPASKARKPAKSVARARAPARKAAPAHKSEARKAPANTRRSPVAAREPARSERASEPAKAAPRTPPSKAVVPAPAKATTSKAAAPKVVAPKAAPPKLPAARPQPVIMMARPTPQVNEPEEGDSIEPGSLLAGPRNVKPYIARRGEQYMGKLQAEHFRAILASWKRDLMEEVDRTVTHMKDEAANFPDPNDRATQEEEFSLELRTRDRERKLIRKIDEALKRIEDGSYGYCLETGEEIGVKRLEARPVATLSIEAQERRERRERQYGDRDDRYR
jgi:DnaK suppressor protein